MKIFCDGIGEAHPDMTGASRAMKPSEYELCQDNGVTDITEVLIGYDGLSMADFARYATIRLGSDAERDLTSRWPPRCRSTANGPTTPTRCGTRSTRTCRTSRSSAYGPPPTSGTRDAFVELAMHAGCEELPFVARRRLRR